MKYDTSRSELLPFVPSEALSLLDIGCGVGRYAQELRETRPHLELWGIEPDKQRAAVARTHFNHFYDESLQEVKEQLPNGHFDVICFNDVLEHLAEPELALRDVASLLSPNGVVIASIPNVRHLGVIMPLIRRGEWHYEDVGILDRTHLRFFTKMSIAALFYGLDWEIYDLQGINLRWHWLDERPRRRLTYARSLLGRRLDNFFYVQYVVTARPKRRTSETSKL